MTTVTDAIRALIVEHAAKNALDAVVVESLIVVESGGNPFAWNPEPRYCYLWDVRSWRPFRAVTAEELTARFPPADFHALAGDDDNEWWGQQASWGLMQIMGAVAREMGFRDPYLPMLCHPVQNLTYGCLKLATDLKWARGDIRSALASYNGGRKGNAPDGALRNAAYAEKVLSQREAVARKHLSMEA